MRLDIDTEWAYEETEALYPYQEFPEREAIPVLTGFSVKLAFTEAVPSFFLRNYHFPYVSYHRMVQDEVIGLGEWWGNDTHSRFQLICINSQFKIRLKGAVHQYLADKDEFKRFVAKAYGDKEILEYLDEDTGAKLFEVLNRDIEEYEHLLYDKRSWKLVVAFRAYSVFLAVGAMRAAEQEVGRLNYYGRFFENGLFYKWKAGDVEVTNKLVNKGQLLLVGTQEVYEGSNLTPKYEEEFKRITGLDPKKFLRRLSSPTEIFKEYLGYSKKLMKL